MSALVAPPLPEIPAMMTTASTPAPATAGIHRPIGAGAPRDGGAAVDAMVYGHSKRNKLRLGASWPIYQRDLRRPGQVTGRQVKGRTTGCRSRSSRRRCTISLMILRITLGDARVLSPLVRGK